MDDRTGDDTAMKHDLFPDRAVEAMNHPCVGPNSARKLLSAALSVSPVLGLSEEELKLLKTAVADVWVIQPADEPKPHAATLLHRKLCVALAAFREDGSNDA